MFQDNIYLHMLFPVLATLIVNGIVFAMKWNKNNNASANRRFLPPGYIIGFIWVVLFALLGAIHWFVRNDKVAAYTLIALMVWCILYPFYTGGLQQSRAVLMNTLTLGIVFTVALILATRGHNKETLYFIPILGWTMYVNIVDAITSK